MLSAKLIVSQPGQRSHSVEVAGPTVSVGRRPDNTICLADANVSKYHAVIEWRDDAYWVSDLGSSNGTTVNGERLGSARRLRNNDLVSLGGTSTLQLFVAEEQADAPDFNATAVGMPPVGQAAPAAPTGASLGAAAVPQMPSTSHVPAMPSTPQVPQMPQAPALPSAPQPPAAAQRILGLPRAVAVGAASLLVVGGLVGVLWGAGIIGDSSAKTSKGKAGRGGERNASNAAVDPAGKGSTADANAGRATTSGGTIDVATPPVLSGGGASAAAGATPALARTLAVQISQKSAYHFDPGFAALINNYVNEYRAAAGYSERAAKYREAIEREFVNVQGIQPPLVAYVLAMSQTKFVERGAGIWNLPPAVVRGHSSGDAPTDMNDPAASTRVAAAYVRSLLDLFERENFMYAVACYGMTLDEAGQVRVALENKDPTGQGRSDFWKMKNAGVVQGVQVERVARFFAAGIVCENPTQFGLREKPFSSLY